MFVSAARRSWSARLDMRDFAFGCDTSAARSHPAFLQGLSNGNRGLLCDKPIAALNPGSYSEIRPLS